MSRLAASLFACLVGAAGPSHATDVAQEAVRMNGNRLELRVPTKPDIRPALSELLRDHSHVMIDHGTINSVHRIDVILLSMSGMRPAPALAALKPAGLGDESGWETPPAEQLVATALSLAPPSDRGSAAEAIAYRAGGEAGATEYVGPVLEQMLSDPDEEVRAHALETLKDTADEVPFDALAQIAREDASVNRRIQALELLVERSENGESREPLAVALNDSEPAVRQRARELMLDWHITLDELRP